MISQVIHTLGKTAIPQDWPRCPKCNRPLLAYQTRDSVNARFKLNTREIFGYCCKCGSVHIELATENTEGIEKYKVIRYRFFVLKPQAWQNVNELPVPAIVTGPAREFDTRFLKD